VREVARRCSSGPGHQGELERYAKSDEARQRRAARSRPSSGAGEAIGAAFGDLKYEAVRGMIVNDKKRLDGRGLADVRPIWIDLGLLPRAHGSAVFTRGETQAL